MTEYDPRFYAKLFDRLGREYLNQPFAQGAVQEVAFLEEELGLRAGMRVLDVGCGTGRHAIELANRGCEVTGVDVSTRLLEVALGEARKADVVINFVNVDAREMRFARKFHAAVCLCEGGFGLLETDRENDRVLAAVREALEPGARFALNVLNLVHLVAEIGNHPGFDAETCYEISTATLRMENGRTEEVAVRDRSYTLPEIAHRLRTAGLRMLAGYGCTPGDFGRHPVDGSRPELLIISERTQDVR